MNLGGIIGSFGFGAVALWAAGRGFSPRALAALVLGAAFVMLAVFAAAPVQLNWMLPLGFVCGVLIFGGMTSLYAVAPLVFPAKVRATGIGIALGVGRVGAIVGPIAAGYLIGLGMPRWEFTLLLALPLLVGAGAILLAPTWSRHPAGR